MPESIKKALTKVANVWDKWSTVQKAVLGGIVLVAVAAVVFVCSYSAKPTTIPLFNVPITDEAARDAILFRLSAENVDPTVNAAGLISVKDEATARRMRAILVREDLVPGNVDPWNLFDVQRWTTTALTEETNVLRSVTAQVKMHIESLDDVDKANVVVTMPKKALFTSQQDPVTASVVLFPKPNSDITTNRKKILGIQKLLQMSVEGLKDEYIVITDANANRLNDFEGMADIDEIEILAKGNKLVAQMETDYRQKILTALQKTFGEDRVRDLNIKIAMDMSKKQSEITEYSAITKKPDNPDTPYDDSEMIDYLPLEMQNVDKTWTGTLYSPEGPAGTAGNVPPNYADMNNTYGTSTEKGLRQTNAVNSKKTVEERKPSIDRVTVSVNIDGVWKKKYDEKGTPIILPNGSIDREYTSLTPQQIAAAEGLVRNAIGYNATRGDAVSVLNIQFDRTAQFENEDFLFVRTLQTRRTVTILIISVIGLILLFVIIRLISKSIEKRRLAREEAERRRREAEEEARLFGASQESMDITMSEEERKRAELMGNVEAMAREHPEDVAQLLRTMMMTE